jgi:hypothetical protein
MMKRVIIIAAAILMMIGSANAQEIKKTIAVANPHIAGVEIEPSLVAKMMRLELVKLEKHNVFDEFDMADIVKTNKEFVTDCFGQKCLISFGEALNVDYILSGSVDGLYNKMAISLKLIDVRAKVIHRSMVKEFENQEVEMQRMIEMMLKDMFKVEFPSEIRSRLMYKNEPITSNNVGQINNSGPRIGIGVLAGDMYEYAMRSERNGGLDVVPMVSMIGYQFEKAYVGTENFSALFEGIINVSGLEQGFFIPTITVMNGFRFGRKGWEFAFGPGLGLKKMQKGFFDTQSKYGIKDEFYTANDWRNYIQEKDGHTLDYYDPSVDNETYDLQESHLHSKGAVKLSTSFVFGLGRTFKAGSLNIPVNLFYSSQKGGSIYGVNVGFNIQKKKAGIHR